TRSHAGKIGQDPVNIAGVFQPRSSNRRSGPGARFQATVRSATKTFPFVSGLNSTATRKMAKPTTVVTRIGPERATLCVVAYKMSSGEISPPQIAPWWKQKRSEER